MNYNNDVKETAFTAIMVTIIIVLGTVPQLGFITITPMIGLTTIHIPLLIGIYFARSRKTAVILGTVFGLTSIIVAFTRPVGYLDPIFTNPLVSVVPRILTALFAYELIKFIKSKDKDNILGLAVFFILSTLVHTILVVIPLYFCGINGFFFNNIYENLEFGLTDTKGTIVWLGEYFNFKANVFTVLLWIFIFNSLAEIAAVTIIGVPVAARLKLYKGNEEE